MVLKMKKKPVEILIVLVIAYLFVGILIVTLQFLTGRDCGPVRVDGDYLYVVNEDASRNAMIRALQWLPTTYDNLYVKDVSLGDFISPKKCLWLKDGETVPEEVRY
jgi:hypothetical protein